MQYLAHPFPYRWIAAVVATFVVAGSATAAEQLAWKLKPDDRLNVTTHQTVTTNTTYTGTAVQSTLTLVIESQWRVTAASEGSIELTQTVKRAKVEMQTPKSEPIVYDSAGDERPTGAARKLQSAVQPLIGLSVQLKMNERGEMLAAELPAEGSEGDKPDEGKTASVSQHMLQSLLSKPIVVLPKDEVSASDTWQDESTSTSSVGEVTTKKTYKLVSLDEVDGGQQAKIAAEGTISVDSQGKLKVTESGFDQTVLFDVEDGLLKSSEQSARMKTEKPYRETTITVDLATTLKTTIERAK